MALLSLTYWCARGKASPGVSAVRGERRSRGKAACPEEHEEQRCAEWGHGDEGAERERLPAGIGSAGAGTWQVEGQPRFLLGGRDGMELKSVHPKHIGGGL